MPFLWEWAIRPIRLSLAGAVGNGDLRDGPDKPEHLLGLDRPWEYDVSITIDGYTLTGADLQSMFGASADGSQTSPTANELVTITGLGSFTTATFSSTDNAFEFSIGSGGSGAVDLGDDGAWVCRSWLCRVPPEHEGSGAGDLIASLLETSAKGRREAALSFACEQSVFEFARRGRQANPQGLFGIATRAAPERGLPIRIPTLPPDRPDDAADRRPPGRSVARAHGGWPAPCA